MAPPDFQIPRPQREPLRAEAPPVIEPPLRDIPDYDGLEVEGVFEPFQSERVRAPVDQELVRRVREVSFGDERVQRALADFRHVVIGVSRRVDDKDRRASATVLVAYRYDDERAVEVWLDGDEDELQVADVVEADYQPAPADEEIERAIELARGHRRLVGAIPDDFEATALLASDVGRGDEHHGRRRFVVGFGPADERAPRIRALVDLGGEEVLAVDATDTEPTRRTVQP